MDIVDTLKRFVTKINPQEVLLFCITLGMTLLLIMLFHYSAISMYVRKHSRCLRERSKGNRSGNYVLYARNEKNEPLYNITYNPNAKTYAIDCACPKGSVSNTFKDIKVYNMTDPENPVKRVQNQCYCERVYDNNKTYYTGYPDLIRFMYNGDKSFFNAVPL